ncbi:MAG: TrbI/VirB10 family protein [Verrucomicrobiae bacterium]|nr:TrbI/VirB10 family protein [Verrucomicrobiae bacterium]
MNPTTLIQFFKSKSGKLLLFGLVFGGGLMVFAVLRDKRSDDDLDLRLESATNRLDRSQVVQTVERPMEVFRPPPPKSEPSRPMPPANAPSTGGPTVAKAEPEPSIPPISLFGDSSAGVVEPKAPPAIYAPFGRLIPCETVVTVDSASIQTPIIGLITEDVYHLGRLVIPAGTELHGTAQTDRARERIASGNAWTLVWQTGEELRLKGIALDREFAGDQEGWGITDGSAGLRGRLLKTDDLAEIKLFAATLLSGAASALTEQQPTIFGNLDSRSLNNAPLKGAQDVLEVYARRILDAIERDGFYVRVPSGKQFYLYVLQTIDRADAGVGGSGVPFPEELEAAPTMTSIRRTPKPPIEP